MSSETQERMCRRNKLGMMADILEVTLESKVKTQVMYRAKLSYAQISEYLPRLIESGLIETTNAKRGKRFITVYKTSKRGMQFIQSYKELMELADPIVLI